MDDDRPLFPMTGLLSWFWNDLIKSLSHGSIQRSFNMLWTSHKAVDAEVSKHTSCKARSSHRVSFPTSIYSLVSPAHNCHLQGHLFKATRESGYLLFCRVIRPLGRIPKGYINWACPPFSHALLFLFRLLSKPEHHSTLIRR